MYIDLSFVYIPVAFKTILSPIKMNNKCCKDFRRSNQHRLLMCRTRSTLYSNKIYIYIIYLSPYIIYLSPFYWRQDITFNTTFRQNRERYIIETFFGWVKCFTGLLTTMKKLKIGQRILFPKMWTPKCKWCQKHELNR